LDNSEKTRWWARVLEEPKDLASGQGKTPKPYRITAGQKGLRLPSSGLLAGVHLLLSSGFTAHCFNSWAGTPWISELAYPEEDIMIQSGE